MTPSELGTPEARAAAPSGDALRTLFAAERTLLAWIRTGLAMMGFGFLVERFGLFLRELAAMRDLPPSKAHGLSLWIGTMLVLLGVAVNVGAAIEHARRARAIGVEAPWAGAGSKFGIGVAVLLAVVGVLMALHLSFLR